MYEPVAVVAAPVAQVFGARLAPWLVIGLVAARAGFLERKELARIILSSTEAEPLLLPT
jgi:hypothetical protein